MTADGIERRQLLLALLALPYVPAVFGQRSPMQNSRFTDESLAKLLPEWPAALRSILRDALRADNGGRIAPEDVARLTASKPIDTLMKELLPIARTYSKPPISNFFVGALAQGASGALYPGANFEVPQNALNQAIHAEQSAIANAFGHKETGIKAIAVTAAPCGHCRQFLNEIAGGGDIRILTLDDQPRPLKSLLPASFGPRDLDQKEALFTSALKPLRLATAGDALAQQALDVAQRAYAPYSKSPSGCAIELSSGVIVSGSYLENAAFNPSLSPLQSALVSVVMHQEDPANIKRVALVEVTGAAITHQAETRMVLAALAPRATLEILTATAA
jgi:cytidine deaminase